MTLSLLILMNLSTGRFRHVEAKLPSGHIQESVFLTKEGMVVKYGLFYTAFVERNPDFVCPKG